MLRREHETLIRIQLHNLWIKRKFFIKNKNHTAANWLIYMVQKKWIASTVLISTDCITNEQCLHPSESANTPVPTSNKASVKQYTGTLLFWSCIFTHTWHDHKYCTAIKAWYGMCNEVSAVVYSGSKDVCRIWFIHLFRVIHNVKPLQTSE